MENKDTKPRPLFGVVEGSLDLGFRVYGPFLSRAHAATQPRPADVHREILEIAVLDRCPIEHSADSVLLWGNVWNGFNLIGPCDNEAALEAATDIDGEYHLSTMRPAYLNEEEAVVVVDFGSVPVGAPLQHDGHHYRKVSHDEAMALIGGQCEPLFKAIAGATPVRANEVCFQRLLPELALQICVPGKEKSVPWASGFVLAGDALRIVLDGADLEWLRNRVSAVTSELDIGTDAQAAANIRIEAELFARLLQRQGMGESFALLSSSPAALLSSPGGEDLAIEDVGEGLGAGPNGVAIAFELQRDGHGEILDSGAIWWADDTADLHTISALAEHGYVDLRCRSEGGINTDVLARLRTLGIPVVDRQWPEGALQRLDADPASASPVSSTDAHPSIYGSGREVYDVLVTMDTTAHRYIRVRADTPEDADETALEVAVDEQGAGFELNEGNFMRRSDFHCADDGPELVDDGQAPSPTN